MTRLRHLLALLLTGVVAACAGLTTSEDEGCVETCAAAYTCGFLPSILGYAATAELSVVDCERRCKQSPREDIYVAGILGCLQGLVKSPADLLPWCGDGDDAYYATGLACSAAASCFATAAGDVQLTSGVSLNVSLISFADYEATFGAGSVEALYDDATTEIQSCSPALCGPAECMRRPDEDRPCNAIMCRNTDTQTVKACDQLQVSALDILVEERSTAIATRELLDETDSTACKQATVTFDSATYHLNPGPVRTFARFGGELPRSALASLSGTAHEETTTGDTDTPGTTGTTGDTGDTGDEVTKYCLQFLGMNVILRGGDNTALIPIGGIEDIVQYRARPTTCDH